MNGSVILMQDVPENTEVGVDMKFWRIGKKFRGIKEIPNGFHYFYYSSVDSDFKSGQRRGFCEWFSEPCFVMKKWLPTEEDFVDVHLTEDDIQRLTDNYEELSMYLGPYPRQLYRDWVALTSLIRPSTMVRLMPECGRITSCAQFLSESSSSQQRLQAKAMESSSVPCNPEELLPKLEVVPGTEIRFTNLPKKPLFPPNCNPIEITAHAIDQTYTLNTLLDKLNSLHEVAPQFDCVSDPPGWLKCLSFEERELLAELQLSYVVFLLNHVLDGWHHWRQMVRLLSNCEVAVGVRPQLYLALISVLYHQLCGAAHSKDFLDSDSAELSTMELADLFFSEVSDSSSSRPGEPAFLPHTIRMLLRNVFNCDAFSSSELRRQLQERAEGFCHCLEQRFHWNLRLDSLRNESTTADIPVDDVDWDDEDAPAIVHI